MFTKWIIGFGLLLATVCGYCLPESASKPVLDIQYWQTSNGARVYFVRTPEVPMLEINVAFAAGSGRDGAKPGLAQLTSSMLNEGTTNMNADQIAAGFDDVGAQFSAAANRDMSTVSLKSLTDAKYLTPALQIFTQVLTSSNFPQQAFDRTQKQTLNAIAAQQQTPDTVAKNAFYKAVYDAQPYGHPVLGTQQSVSALTQNDLINFYKKYYVAKNAVITLVGAIDRQQAEAIANQLVSSLPAGDASPTLAFSSPGQSDVQKIKFPSEQTNIIMGQVGINYHDLDYFPLIVGNYVVGGAPLTSRLFAQVRVQRGLAYSVGSNFSPLNAGGPFAIVLQTRNDQADQALKVVRETLNEFLQSGPTEAELTATRKKIINAFPLTLAGNDAISSQLMMIGFYQLPMNYLDTYRQKVNAVTVDQIKTAFRQKIKLDKMVTIMVGK